MKKYIYYSKLLRKKIIVLVTCLLGTLTHDLWAQVGVGHTNPDPTSKMDVKGQVIIRDIPQDTFKSGEVIFPLVSDPNDVSTSRADLRGGGGRVKYLFIDTNLIKGNQTIVWNSRTNRWEIAPSPSNIIGTGPIKVTFNTRTSTYEITLEGCREENHLIIWRNGRWECISKDEISFTLTGCLPNQVPVWDGTKWVCRDLPLGSNLVTRAPIVIRPGRNPNDPDTVTFAQPGPGSGDSIIIWNPLTGQWEIRENQDFNWTLKGNIITPDRYIGTNNAQPFRMFTNRTERMRITPDGRVIVNNTAGDPTDRFSIFAAQDEFGLHAYGNGAFGAAIFATNSNTNGVALIAVGNNKQPGSIPIQGAGIIAGGSNYGTYAFAESRDPNTSSFAVFGESNGIANNTAGVVGITNERSPNGPTFGVIGESYSNQSLSAGVKGVAYGSSGIITGVYGSSLSTGNFSAGLEGFSLAGSGATYGVIGTSSSSDLGAAGVYGQAREGIGGHYGVYGVSNRRTNQTAGVQGYVFGIGENGATYYGVAGVAAKSGQNSTLIGVYGQAQASGSNAAGLFNGNVFIANDLAVSGVKQFKIDHPLDPANKYLTHICPESPEPLNIYSGNITTDANGLATVTLPAYFEKINKDFRYTLTCIGQQAHAFVVQEIQNNQFVIKTDKPNVKVSWMITAIRNDLYLQQNPIMAETEKEQHNKGKYLHPELYGKTNTAAIYPIQNIDSKAQEGYNTQQALERAKASVGNSIAKKVFKK
ncbi:MAG: hypothetical protein RML72_11540 [Bacteroidia bacterium]|nr:hypothetical protein [Bacteroidia bacterium]MDW8159489.1 hypothetical protein [Bacteroidia bacterium]